MPRPPCCRRIAGRPAATGFAPTGARGRAAQHVVLALDELEAIRLADLEGLYHEQAAARMGVSRATFGRIIAAARHKVAAALVQGRRLTIAGGPVRSAADEPVACPRCAGEPWKQAQCPRCAQQRPEGRARCPAGTAEEKSR